jgi:putative flippase GtrA
VSKFSSVVRRAWDGLVRYAVKFGVIGLIGFFIDAGIFTLLRVGTFGDGWWSQAIAAKVISTSFAIVFNWVGNRYWTFREHRRKNFVLEAIEYIVVSVGGLLISLACLYISHHVLGLTTVLADNISANVIGLGLGTIFRFLLYRYWVYGLHRSDGLAKLASAEEGQRSLFEEPSHDAEPGTQAPTFGDNRGVERS